ncbi:aquaporin-4-like isoform X1, partial [Biomphalaria pfeifferi]
MSTREVTVTAALISPSSPNSDVQEPAVRPSSLPSIASGVSTASLHPTASSSRDNLSEREPGSRRHPVGGEAGHRKPRLAEFDPELEPRLELVKVTSPKDSNAMPDSGKQQKTATSMEDISSLRLWKGIVAEFVGTLLLTLVGCGSCINLRGAANTTSNVVQIALCFGLSVATIVWSIAHVSGGHINPAVTMAMLAARKISLAKAVFFVLFQLIGAVVGAGILLGLTPEKDQSALGMTLVHDKISVGQAVGVELFITFVLVFTVFASCDNKRKDLNGSAPLAIGLSVTMCHLWAIDYTGSSMNTARSFGPALVMGTWDNHWVYWVGPILGGVAAGVLYEHLFAVNASLDKAKACLLSSDYDDAKYKAKKYK